MPRGPQARSQSWEEQSGSSMAKGGPQDRIVSTKNPLSPSWDPEQTKKMPVERTSWTLSKRKAQQPHICHLSPLGGS